MKTNRRKTQTRLQAALLLALGAGALASPIANAQLEEVIVTAERRTESSQDVPLAITTFSGDKVSASGMSGFGDVALETPNLTFTQFNIAEPQLYLRGVGSSSDSAGADPTVSMFIDGVYVGRSGGGISDLYDLDRIEVLRGPQGTLYGRNVTGGAISVYTKKPTEEFDAKVGVTVGDYGLTLLRGYANGALSENVAGKISVSKRDRDGYSENVTSGQEHDNADNLSLRGQLLWNASDATDIVFSADHSTDDTNGGCRDIIALDDPNPAAGGAFIPLIRNAIATVGVDDPRKCGQSLIQFAEKDVSGLSMEVNHDFGATQLTSITAYREADYEWVQELAGLDSPPMSLSVQANEEEQSDQLSQEFRLSGSNDNLFWVAGAFGFVENVDRRAASPLRILGNFVRDSEFTQKAKNSSYALFGQLTWSMTDSLDLTVGGRQTWDDKKIDQRFTTEARNNVVYDLNGLEDDWSQFTPRVSLDWKVNDNAMVYATYSEGYKSGLFLSQQSSPITAGTTLDPEEATNYEIGAKTEWFDNRFRFNITYFDLEVENLQLFRLENLMLITENADQESSGIEVDFIAAITDNFTLSGTYATLDSEFVGGQFDGNSVARSPDTAYSLVAAYNAPMSNGSTLDFRASAAYSDEYYMEATNTQRSLTDDYTSIDASVKYTSAEGDWDLELWGKNLSDELIIAHSIDGSLGGTVALYAPPKTVGVSFNYYW